MFYIKRKKKDDDLTYLERVYRKTVKKNPKSYLYLPLASVYYHKGDIKKAIKTLQKGLSVNPNYITAEFYLALLYRENGEVDKAVEILEKVVFASQDHYAAHKSLVQHYLDTKSEKNALMELKELTRLVPSDILARDQQKQLEEKLKETTETPTPAPEHDVAVAPSPEAEDEQPLLILKDYDEITQTSDILDEEILIPDAEDTVVTALENEDEEKSGESKYIPVITLHQPKEHTGEKKDQPEASEKIVSSLENWLKNIDRVK